VTVGRAAGWGILLVLGLAATLPAAELPAGFRDRLVVGGLDQPVACEFAPDGRLFILLKGGQVRIARDGELVPEPALRLAVNSEGERGLLGLAFDPKFENKRFIYLYYTTDEASPGNRVSRFRVQGDRIDPASERILVAGIRSDASNHNAGWLRFGPDRKLYVSTGDGGREAELAQQLTSLNGKILRIKRNGRAPRGNPFLGSASAREEIWCYGLRNPWRFSFDRASGALWIGDVGVSTDEINLGGPGLNYGWPLVEGPSSDPRFVNPVHAYSFGSGNALIGGLIYRGANFPAEYRGDYFFADFLQQFIRILELDADLNLVAVRDFAADVGGIVHLIEGPDGALYYVTLEGQIRRIFFRG